MKPMPLVLGLLLAAGSFGYGRHHYVSKNTATLAIGKTTFSGTNPLADKKLFGDWIKDEWLLAIALPAAFVVGGLALAVKK